MARFIDLTLPLSEDIVLVPSRLFKAGFPEYPRPKFTRMMTPESDPMERRTVTHMSMLCHTGTHLDAPMHFVPDGTPVDQIPLSVLVGDALVADFFHKEEAQAITAEELSNELGDEIEPGLRLIIRTGYTTKHWGTEDYYLGGPYLAADAAEWIVAKGFVLCVFDFVPDRVLDQSFAVHLTLLGAGIPFVEYPINVEEIKGKRVRLYVVPMKLQGVDGAPARVFVEEPANG